MVYSPMMVLRDFTLASTSAKNFTTSDSAFLSNAAHGSLVLLIAGARVCFHPFNLKNFIFLE